MGFQNHPVLPLLCFHYYLQVSRGKLCLHLRHRLIFLYVYTAALWFWCTLELWDSSSTGLRSSRLRISTGSSITGSNESCLLRVFLIPGVSSTEPHNRTSPCTALSHLCLSKLPLVPYPIRPFGGFHFSITKGLSPSSRGASLMATA